MEYATGTGNFIMVDDYLVEKDALRIAEAIKEYDPNIEVLCLDPSRAEGVTEEPFIIAEKCKDGVLRPIFKVWELNDMVLLRIKLADGKNFNALKTIEQTEADYKAANERRYKEFREEAADKVKHIAGMKSKYTVEDSITGELITFYDDRPSTRTPVKGS